MRRHHRSPTLTLLALSLFGLTACGAKIRLSDDIDYIWDREPSQTYDGVLHGPYVAGAQFEIYAYDITDENQLDGWTIVSLDPGVAQVGPVEVIRDDIYEDDGEHDRSDVMVATVETIGPGSATLEIRRPSGRVVRTTELTVMQPDRVELHAAGPLFIDGEANDLVDSTPKLAVDGRATFLVEWYAGDERLFGVGALDLATDAPGVSALLTGTEHLGERREWAQIEFSGPADTLASVDFLANGEPATTLDFELVGPDAVDSIELIQSSSVGARRWEILAVLAQAFDVDGEPIWGVAFDWDIDGDIEPEEGDIFRYYYEPETSSVLGAEFGGARAEITISGDEGFVESSNEDPIDGSCDCRAGEDRPGRGVALGILGLLALGLVRRRRRSLGA